MSRIMIFAEAVTLAHVGRPIALSRVLRSLGHEVCIAAAPAADRWLAGENVARERIESIDSQAFLRALARGIPAYDVETLKRYVEDDLRAISSWRPDVVIGDFRLSLYISARKAGKPYGAIANAYWSRRYWNGVGAPPIAPLSWLPRRLADSLFGAICPAAFALHAAPFHRACEQFGVPSPGLDIRDVYTASDATAFADVKLLYEHVQTRDQDRFIGPLGWEPREAQPLPVIAGTPRIVFISMGSSGSVRALSQIVHVLASLDVRFIVATTLGAQSLAMPGNCVFSAPFIRYREACKVASLVISNGGAPATYAALGQGRPIIAIPSNLDQVLNARTVAAFGAGEIVPPGPRFTTRLAGAIRRLIDDVSVRRAAERASRALDGPFELSVERWLAPLIESAAVKPGVDPAYSQR